MFTFIHSHLWLWQDGMAAETFRPSTTSSSVDVMYFVFAIRFCQLLCILTGHEDVVLVVDDMWTVCLMCRLILTCTVIQSPSTPCKRSDQSVI